MLHITYMSLSAGHAAPRRSSNHKIIVLGAFFTRDGGKALKLVLRIKTSEHYQGSKLFVHSQHQYRVKGFWKFQRETIKTDQRIFLAQNVYNWKNNLPFNTYLIGST